jgi:hypothetical protein
MMQQMKRQNRLIAPKLIESKRGAADPNFLGLRFL